MGKSQKKRAMRRHNPMRVPDSHLPTGLASASSSSSKTNDILPILHKMESVDVADRKWACIAVSNLIQNDPSTRRLLQGKNVVGALITRLTDSEEEVVAEATGALRNLCIDGGYDICAEMYNKNIMASLREFVPKISSTLSQYLQNPKSASESAKIMVHAFADNVITILWCLSETSNKALDAVNELKLVPFLMSFLASRGQIALSTVVSAAQCLYVLTDDNAPASREVKSQADYIACLLQIVQEELSNISGKGKERLHESSTALAVLAAGILRNISPFTAPSDSPVDVDKDIAIPLLIPVISSVSLPDIAGTVAQHIMNPDTDIVMDKAPIKGLPKSDHKTPTEVELDRLEAKLKTTHLALEILTGVCATLPDASIDIAADNEAAGEAEDDDVEDMEDMANLDEQEDEADDIVEDTEDPAPSATSALLPSLVQHILSLIQSTELSFPPFDGPSPCPPITVALSSIHVSALQCLNNIFLSLAASKNPSIAQDKQAGQKLWEDVWRCLASVGTTYGPGQERREEMWSIGAGVLWGIAMIWKGSLVPDQEKVQVLIQYCEATSDHTNRVKAIGALECLAQHPASVQLNQVISSFLLSVITSPDAGPEPTVQAASAMIDIYSDEDMPYDINFRQGGYIQKLEDSVINVKKAVKSFDRHKHEGRELRKRGDLVRQNLIDFLRYRRGLRL